MYSTSQKFFIIASKGFSLLPLPVVHFLGCMLGWCMYALSGTTARLIQENLESSHLCESRKRFRYVLRKNIAETGKAILESFSIWGRSTESQLSLVSRCDGWEAVETAVAEGHGLIFLTPHLGCFEITSLYYAARYPIAILYRPPKKKWMAPLMETGRARGHARLAPTNTQGVRTLMSALRRGEAVGILPDQIPAKGEGEWATFFGRPAYTMTLAGRLAEKTGAAVFMVFGKRLSWGRGYHIIIKRLEKGSIDTPEGLNRSIEAQVQECPEQYLWNYHRFKVRKRSKPLLSQLSN